MSIPPKSEKGHPGGYTTSFVPQGGRKQYAVESPDHWAPELRFPESTVLLDLMRNEPHLASILESVTGPVADADWHLTTEGVPDEVLALCNTELGLTTTDQPLSGIAHQGVDIKEHIAEMMSTLAWAGFACAEMVYNPGPPTPAQVEAGITEDVVHLRKLAPRPPRTISRIPVDRDGGLKGIEQTPLDGINVVEIPVNRLVFYTLNKEGGDWTGRSVIRPAYQPWALKDIYMKLDAQAVEKHAMGYWHGTTGDGSQTDDLYDALSELRSGERSAIVTPPGTTVQLIGVNGGTIDIVPRLKYLDQEMSRMALAMFLDLGHDNGARSLGETHLKVFLRKLQGIANYIGRTVTRHIIRDLVEYNYPAGTPYPKLVPGQLASQQGVVADTLKTLMDAGAVTYDSALETQIREEFGFVPKPEGAPAVPNSVKEDPVPQDTTDPEATELRSALSHADDLYAELRRRVA